MSTITNFNFGPSDDVKVVDVSEFEQDGEIISRVVVDVHGHDVQILAYDNSPQVVVKVDGAVEQMHISEIDHFIRAHTEE